MTKKDTKTLQTSSRKLDTVEQSKEDITDNYSRIKISPVAKRMAEKNNLNFQNLT